MKWVKIEDELPDYDVFVLWCMEEGYMFIAEIDHDCSWQTFKEMYEHDEFSDKPLKITHWMTLPELPEPEVKVKICPMTKKNCEYICVMIDCYLNKEPNVQASVATEDDSSKTAG